MEYFFSINNPLFFILLTGFILFVLMYTIITKFLIPMQRTHTEEKTALELKNEKMNALFTTFSPNPVFRFDRKGEILLTNNAGFAVFGEGNPVGKNIREVFPAVGNLDIENFIAEVKELSIDVSLLDHQFSVILKGVPDMDFGHIYCFDITERKKYEEDLEYTKWKLRELAAHLQELRESDRNTVAMELHDNICQRLSTIKLTAENFDMAIFTNEQSTRRYHEMISIVDDLIVDTRELSYSLKPRYLGEFGLVPALETLIEQTVSKSGMKGTFNHYGFEERLDPKLEINIYRIIQELLNNIVRHSEATRFIVQIFKNDISVKVLVQDNGIGLRSDAGSRWHGLGLLNIRERVNSFNGIVNFESQVNKGTETIIEFPKG